jgi:hypothetical protein
LHNYEKYRYSLPNFLFVNVRMHSDFIPGYGREREKEKCLQMGET